MNVTLTKKATGLARLFKPICLKKELYNIGSKAGGGKRLI